MCQCDCNSARRSIAALHHHQMAVDNASKNNLQELFAARCAANPTYDTGKSAANPGLDHLPIFISTVSHPDWGGRTFVGEGNSKKEAEKIAAAKALVFETNRPRNGAVGVPAPHSPLSPSPSEIPPPPQPQQPAPVRNHAASSQGGARAALMTPSALHGPTPDYGNDPLHTVSDLESALPVHNAAARGTGSSAPSSTREPAKTFHTNPTDIPSVTRVVLFDLDLHHAHALEYAPTPGDFVAGYLSRDHSLDTSRAKFPVHFVNSLSPGAVAVTMQWDLSKLMYQGRLPSTAEVWAVGSRHLEPLEDVVAERLGVRVRVCTNWEDFRPRARGGGA